MMLGMEAPQRGSSVALSIEKWDSCWEELGGSGCEEQKELRIYH